MNKKERSEIIKVLAYADSNNFDYVSTLLIEKLNLNEYDDDLLPAWETYNDEELQSIVNQGNDKITWIKLFKERINNLYGFVCSLKDAKDICDRRWK